MLPVAIFFTVQHPAVQLRLVHEATHMLSEKLHTTVSVNSIRFRLFNRLVLEGVYVQDLKGDTLLYAGEAAVSLSRIGFAEKYIEIGKLELDNVNMSLLRDSAGTNLNFIIDGLKSDKPDTAPKPKSEKPYQLRVNRVVAQGVNFKFVDELAPDSSYENSINYKDLEVRNLAIDVRELNLEGDTMSCRLESLNFRERSGFNLHRLGGFVSIAPTFIEVKNLQVLDDYSDIRARFYRMDFDDYSAFPDYIERVRMSADFTSAKVDLYTIGFFAAKMAKVHLPVNLTGYASGPVSNLKGRNLDIKYGSKTAIKVNFSMAGIPDVHNTFFTFDVKELTSNGKDLMLADKMVLDGQLAQHDKLLQQLGTLRGRARFTGFLSSFVADGTLATDKGTLITDLSFVPSPDSAVYINGTLGTDNFDFGSVLGDSILGRLSFHGKANGTFKSVKKMALNLDVDVPLVELKGYGYQGTKMKGLLTEKSFRGALSSKDKNLDFDFYGNVDFEKENPIFDFNLQLRHADLVNLKLNTRDSISQLSLTAKADVEGSSMDKFTGQILVTQSKYLSHKGEFSTDSIMLAAKDRNGQKSITLRSDMLDASLLAKGSVSNIASTLNFVVATYIPALPKLLNEEKLKQVLADETVKTSEIEPVDKKQERNGDNLKSKKSEYNFSISVKKAKKAFDIIAPDFALADSTQFRGRISTDVQRVWLNASTSQLRVGKIKVNNLTLRSSVRDSILQLAVKVSEITNGDLSLEDLNASAALKDGKADISALYKTTIASGSLKAETQIFQDKKGGIGVDVELFPSQVVLGDTIWNLSQSRLRLEKGKFSLAHFRIDNAHQMLYANGVISQNMSDTLTCELRNISLAPILRSLGVRFDLTGTLSGKAAINGVLAPAPLFFADIKAANIFVAKKEVGNITLESSIEEGEKDITLRLSVERAGVETLGLAGILKPAGEVNAVAKLNGVELYYLNPLLNEVLSDINGLLSGNVKVTGPIKDLKLNGKLQVADGTLRVNLLNALFKVGGTVDVENSTLYMRDWAARDDKGTTSKLNFTLGNVTQPSKLYYTLRVEPKKFHVLNSNELQNETFYGQGYATGVVQIHGRSGEVGINAVATTDPNTQLSIPLSGASSGGQSANFIDFVTPATKKEVKEDEVEQASNLKADLDFRVTPDAEVQLVLNQNTGDVIKAAGSGNIKLEVQPANNIFRVFGNYNLLRGEYAISVQNLFSIKFKIDNGSVINFNGDVSAATADIQATYKLRAPLAPLLDSTYKRPVPIDCKVRMTGRLTSPDLKFSIDAPTVDAETRDRMQAQLNTEDNVVTQFMALIIMGQFMSSQGSSGTTLTDGITGHTLSSFLTSQVTGLISQFVDVDVAVNIPDVGQGNPDWGVSLSTNIGKKISVSSSVEYQSQRNQTNPNASQYVGDVDVDYMVDPQGKLRLRAFSHANDQYTNMVQNSNRYGVGVVYQEDFDSFADLWQAIFRKKKQQDSLKVEKEKQVEKQKEKMP